MKNKSYKHWIIMILMCCLSASSIGLCINSVGVFYTPVSKSLGVLKGSFALHATLSSLATAAVSLFMAKILRKYKYKKFLLIGIMLASGSTFLMGFSKSLFLFYVLGVVRGIGVGMYAMVPLTIIITNWFVEKHGVATSIALSFSGLSSAIFSPLLSTWIINYGWQKTYILMALCIFLLTLPALIYRWTTNPRDMQLLPYGYTEEIKPKKVVNTKFNVYTISFICVSCFTIMHTSITGISQHLSGIATSVGLSITIGATMMSFTMIGNIVTKLIIGFISDLLNPIKASMIMITVNICSLCLLLTGMNKSSSTILLISSLIFGSIYSVGAVGIPLLTRYFFGNENYTSAYSIIGFLTSVGSSSSLTTIGYIYDFTGGYQIVIVIGVLIHFINLLLLIIVWRRYKKDYPSKLAGSIN